MRHVSRFTPRLHLSFSSVICHLSSVICHALRLSLMDQPLPLTRPVM